jgi:hypothetical protein
MGDNASICMVDRWGWRLRMRYLDASNRTDRDSDSIPHESADIHSMLYVYDIYVIISIDYLYVNPYKYNTFELADLSP